jgi:hypothetical protein
MSTYSTGLRRAASAVLFTVTAATAVTGSVWIFATSTPEERVQAVEFAAQSHGSLPLVLAHGWPTTAPEVA